MTQRERILAAIRRIPRGTVSTYGAVARAAGFPGAARQVVWALHGCGPDVPWQRVVGAGGKVLLKGAPALEQRLRLRTEGVSFRGERVAMDRHEFQFTRRSRK
jgi:methylated-DNA-protein-cysteine methyltransferase-like protein